MCCEEGNGIEYFCSPFPWSLSHTTSLETILLGGKIVLWLLTEKKSQYCPIEKLYWSKCAFFLPSLVSDCLLGQYIYNLKKKKKQFLWLPEYLYCYSEKVLAAQDIPLQRILLIRRVYDQTKLFLCVHVLFQICESSETKLFSPWGHLHYLQLSLICASILFFHRKIFFVKKKKRENGTKYQQLWSFQ